MGERPTIKEEREVVVEVKLFDLDLPRDLISLSVVLQCDREVTLLDHHPKLG